MIDYFDTQLLDEDELIECQQRERDRQTKEKRENDVRMLRAKSRGGFRAGMI